MTNMMNENNMKAAIVWYTDRVGKVEVIVLKNVHKDVSKWTKYTTDGVTHISMVSDLDEYLKDYYKSFKDKYLPFNKQLLLKSLIGAFKKQYKNVELIVENEIKAEYNI